MKYSDSIWRRGYKGLYHDRHGRKVSPEDERRAVQEALPRGDTRGKEPRNNVDEFLGQSNEVSKSWKGRASVVVLTPKFTANAWAEFKRRRLRELSKEDNPTKALRPLRGTSTVAGSRSQAWRKMSPYTDAMPLEGSLKDLCFVEVGIFDGGKMHSYDGDYAEPIDYESLFRILMSIGYDPLLPLRENGKFRDRFREKIGTALLKGYSKRGRDRLQAVYMKVKAVAQEAKCFIKDYIVGGMKPPLSENTMKKRRRHGISGDVPLYASGLLAYDVDARVVSAASSRLRIARSDHATKTREEKKKKAKREREIATAAANRAKREAKRAADAAEREAKRAARKAKRAAEAAEREREFEKANKERQRAIYAAMEAEEEAKRAERMRLYALKEENEAEYYAQLAKVVQERDAARAAPKAEIASAKAERAARNSKSGRMSKSEEDSFVASVLNSSVGKAKKTGAAKGRAAPVRRKPNTSYFVPKFFKGLLTSLTRKDAAKYRKSLADQLKTEKDDAMRKYLTSRLDAVDEAFMKSRMASEGSVAMQDSDVFDLAVRIAEEQGRAET